MYRNSLELYINNILTVLNVYTKKDQGTFYQFVSRVQKTQAETKILYCFIGGMSTFQI